MASNCTGMYFGYLALPKSSYFHLHLSVHLFMSTRDVRMQTFWHLHPSASADFVSAGSSRQASAHICEWDEGHGC